MGKGAVVVLLLLLAASGHAGGLFSRDPPSFLPAPPSPPAGQDWFAIWDGSKWGTRFVDTLSSANSKWRSVNQSTRAAQLWRYSHPLRKWLKVA